MRYEEKFCFTLVVKYNFGILSSRPPTLKMAYNTSALVLFIYLMFFWLEIPPDFPSQMPQLLICINSSVTLCDFWFYKFGQVLNILFKY